MWFADVRGVTDEQPELEIPEIGQLWKHAKTERIYAVLLVAKHTETLQQVVAYRDYKDWTAQIWARPLEMFLEEVSPGQPRFVRIS